MLSECCIRITDCTAGSGKTTFAQTLMEKLGCRILCNGSAPSLSFKDGAEAAIKILTQLFEMATHTPHLLCCVFLDEVEAIALQKGKVCSAEQKLVRDA